MGANAYDAVFEDHGLVVEQAAAVEKQLHEGQQDEHREKVEAVAVERSI